MALEWNMFSFMALLGGMVSAGRMVCETWWVQIVRYVLTWRSYSFICTLHHLIIIIVQAYLKILKIRGTVCFQLPHFPCDDWENIYTLSYHHHQIGSMNYYPLFRVRSWNNGVRCMSFCILMTPSNGNIFHVNGPLWGESTCGFPHKGQWRRALIFSFICIWTNDWANNWVVSDLRRHRTHYDVIIIYWRHVWLCT